MIELSKSKISFVKIQDITYVLVHGLISKKLADSLIDQVSEVFEERSRAKFHSDDPEQVFSGASAVFNKTVEELFSAVLKYTQKEQEKESVGLDLELVNIQMNYDQLVIIPKAIVKKTEEKKLSEQVKQADPEEDISEEQKLSALTFNILNSLVGIEHLVFVEHEDNKTRLFFKNGKLSEKLVSKTLKICEKYLENILSLMEDESVENAIEVTEEYQIIFVPLNASNFMYAIATKSVDPVLLNPVFERIAKRIKDAVLEYKKELK